MNKKQKMNEAILKHGFRLQDYFGMTDTSQPTTLCKRLFRVENKAHRLAEDYCNGVIDEMPDFTKRVINILKDYGATKNMDKVFINQDPRGYALKLELANSSEFYYTDLGGYGIIAPDFREVK